MLNLTFSPYCAEFQMVTIANGVETRWPRRPRSELIRGVNFVRQSGAFVRGLALYNTHDECLYVDRRWLEKRWGYNLVMKKRRSKRYTKLWDAILRPCSGPVVLASGSGAIAVGGGRKNVSYPGAWSGTVG